MSDLELAPPTRTATASGLSTPHLLRQADQTSPGRTAAPPGALLRGTELIKSYHKGRQTIPVLRGASLEIFAGEHLAIIGQSGSGKSTLMHLLATLDAPDSGEVHFAGRRVDHLPASARETLRNGQIGMIFQFYHLLPELSALENVLAPLMVRHSVWGYLRRRRSLVAEARRLLDLVGLSHRLSHRPRELSGGEMQRAAIARALMAHPRVILADEPTGNLDPATGREILSLLRTLNAQEGLTIVMVSHDLGIAHEADRVVRLVEGRVETA